MYTRKHHQKSKNGCRQCKKRRVKARTAAAVRHPQCDERIPCGACIKRQAFCSLTVTPPPIEAGARDGGDGREESEAAPTSTGAESGFFSPSDFALYNHWMQSTSLVVASEPFDSDVWRTTVPLIAPRHPHLLHEIMAVSAIHLSRLTPPSAGGEAAAYAKTAAEHQGRAFRLFRTALAEASPANAAAVFSTSALMVLYYFVAAEDPATLLFSEDPPGPPQWMHPIRGCVTILRQLEQSLRSGPLGDMLREHTARNVTPDEMARSPSDRHVVALRDAMCAEDREVFRQDIEELRISFAISDLGDQMSCKQGMLRQPTRWSDAFTRALGLKAQGAFVLSAFWLVLQARVRRGWMRGPCGPKDIMDVIIRHCTPESLALIEWPVQEVTRLESL